MGFYAIPGLCWNIFSVGLQLLTAYVVLMLYYVNFIVINDGMFVRNMVNILYENVFLTIMKT